MRAGPIVIFHVTEQQVTEVALAGYNNVVKAEIAGSLFPAASFRDLICDPFCGWMRCDAKPQNMSPTVPQDQEPIQQAKRHCRHDEHIHRSDPISVIAEECPPALGRRVSSPDHVLGHAGLSDTDA